MGPDTMADLCVACFCTACGTCQEAMEIDDATGALLRVNPRKVGSDNGRLRIDASNTILERPEWRVVYTRFIDELIRYLQCFIFVFSCPVSSKSHLFRIILSAKANCSTDSFSAPSGFSSSRCDSTCAASTTVIIPH